MRITIDINDELLREAKRRAAKEGVRLHEIIEGALRDHFGNRSAGRPRYRLRWRTESGRLQPGVRLDNRDALFDLMEGRR